MYNVWSSLIADYGSTGYGCQPCCSRSGEQGKLFFLRVSVRPGEFGLARQVRPFRPASARSFSTPGWNISYIIDIYLSMVTDTVAPTSDFARQKIRAVRTPFVLSLSPTNTVYSIQYNIVYSMQHGVFKKNLNASKPSEHLLSGGKMSKGLGGNIGCRDKTSSWYIKRVPQCNHIGSTV